MRIFFFLGRTFLKQSLAIAKEFKNRYPDSEFMALVGARNDTLKFIKKYEDPAFKHITWLNEMEKKWLATPLDKNRLEYYRNKLGNENLKRLLISDRDIGAGYISGGVITRTRLIDKTKDNDEKRWAIVVGLLDYLFETCEQEKPDFIFVYCIAASHVLAMQIVGTYLGITVVEPVMSHVKNYFILDNTAYQKLSVVQHSFKKLLNNEITLPKSTEEAKNFLHEFRNKPMPPEYNHKFQDIVEGQAKILGMIKTFAVDFARMMAIKFGLFGTKGVFRQRNGFDILKENIKVFFASRSAIKGKQFEQLEKFKDDDYIYYPLHVDPEASTMVLAPYHTDQIAVIEAISKQMPAGMKLLVKEHVPSIGRRPKGFYERIKSIPDVHLISPFVNGFSVIKNAKLTCVITGTAGKEAILLGRPVLVIGSMHFSNLDESITCKNIYNLESEIEQAINKKPIDEDKLIKYLSALIEEGLEISVNDMWQDSNDYNIESHMGLAKLFADKMLRLKEVTSLASAGN